MAVTYTNRKGITYTLYRSQTKSGKPRYVFGRGRAGEEVADLPPGFAIRESVNGVVSLARDRPSMIDPAEVVAVEAAVRRLPRAHRYRVVAKHDRIEVYADERREIAEVLGGSWAARLAQPGMAERLREAEELFARYSPVLRFILVEREGRVFGAERMCYLGRIDGWLRLGKTGTVDDLARDLVATLDTDEFFDLW